MRAKRLFLIMFINALAFLATAQHQTNWMSISIGTAVPFNDFSDKVLTDTVLHGGFAKTGLAFNLTYTHQLVRTFGITAMFMGNSNNTDINAMEKEFQRYIKGNSKIENFTHAGSIGKWNTGMLFIGPNINFGERFFFVEIRGLLGVGMGFSPEYDYMITPAQGPLTGKTIKFKQQSDNAVAFAWNIGAGMKYRFDRLFVRLNVDYSATNLEYKNINVQFYNPTDIAEKDYINRNSKMNIQTDIMQVTGGFGFIF
jgi:opacity protein-like surface antigen